MITEQSSGLSPEMQALLQANGVDPAMLANLGGGAAVSSSPPVYFGETRVQTADGDVLRARGGKNKFGGKKTKSLDEANQAFYELSQNELIEFQRRLVAAGVIDPDQLRLGDFTDSKTQDAWTAINTHSAKFYASGKKVTPNDVLSMIERAYDPRNEEAEKADQRRALLASFGTAVHQYKRSDPAELRVQAEAAFREAIGRKPKKDELDKFVNNFLGAERANQSAQFAAADSVEAAQRERRLAAFDASGQGAGGLGAGGNKVEPFASSEMEASMSESDVLWNRLQRMVADSPYKIGLGKRDRPLEEQKRLYANWKAGKGPRAAKPGTSKHGDGRANDLKYYGNEKARQWVIANASKYGLALPLYDPNLPRSKDESWHVEVMTGPGLGKGRAAAHANHGGHVEGDVAPISTFITDQAQNSAAQAIEFARRQNPVETAAYDIGGQFQSLLGILQKGVV